MRSRPSTRRAGTRRLLTAASLLALLGLGGCYYPYGPYGYAAPGYGYGYVAAPVVGGGYYAPGYYRGYR